MTNTSDGKLETNKHIITIVVVGLVFNGTIGMLTLAYCMVFEKKPDVALFTAFVALANYIFGVISGSLLKTSATATTSPTTEIKPAGKIEVPAQTLETTKTL